MVLALQDSYPSTSQNIQFASVGTAAKFPPIYLSPSDTRVTSLIHSTVHTSKHLCGGSVLWRVRETIFSVSYTVHKLVFIPKALKGRHFIPKALNIFTA